MCGYVDSKEQKKSGLWKFPTCFQRLRKTWHLDICLMDFGETIYRKWLPWTRGWFQAFHSHPVGLQYIFSYFFQVVCILFSDYGSTTMLLKMDPTEVDSTCCAGATGGVWPVWSKTTAPWQMKLLFRVVIIRDYIDKPWIIYTWVYRVYRELFYHIRDEISHPVMSGVIKWNTFLGGIKLDGKYLGTFWGIFRHSSQLELQYWFPIIRVL